MYGIPLTTFEPPPVILQALGVGQPSAMVAPGLATGLPASAGPPADQDPFAARDMGAPPTPAAPLAGWGIITAPGMSDAAGHYWGGPPASFPPQPGRAAATALWAATQPPPAAAAPDWAAVLRPEAAAGAAGGPGDTLLGRAEPSGVASEWGPMLEARELLSSGAAGLGPMAAGRHGGAGVPSGGAGAELRGPAGGPSQEPSRTAGLVDAALTAGLLPPCGAAGSGSRAPGDRQLPPREAAALGAGALLGPQGLGSAGAGEGSQLAAVMQCLWHCQAFRRLVGDTLFFMLCWGVRIHVILGGENMCIDISL